MSILNENSPELTFKTISEVKAYSKFFLKKNPIESQCEFKTQEEWDDFCARREIQLQAQLDFLKKIDFSKANVTSIRKNYFKIVPKRYSDPLSSIGSEKASSRFNYKDVSHLKNRVIYFGKTQQCCEVEKFHLEYQQQQLKQILSPADELDIQFSHIEPQTVYEYDVVLDNVLVLTTKPSCDAVGITMATYHNEWFEINDEYEVPSSSQILGAIARKQGFNAIMYTSIRTQDEHNLVIFEDNTSKLDFKLISAKEFKPTFSLL